MAIPTPHISAKKEDIAKTVLMPGDPLRSEFIAKTFLKNPVLVNDVRGVHGYTGEYNGKKVTVMASGMGQPSIGIYSYELYNFYDVDAIIRVGTCGSFHPDLHARDIIVAMGACTNGNYAMQYKLPGTFAPIADFDLVRRAVEECEKAGVNYKVGNIFSSDTFYDDANSGMDWGRDGIRRTLLQCRTCRQKGTLHLHRQRFLYLSRRKYHCRGASKFLHRYDEDRA